MPKTIFTGANQVVVEIVRKARTDAGITQVELARRLGRDQSHISLIERSQRRLDVVEFIEFAKAVGTDPVSLFKILTEKLEAE